MKVQTSEATVVAYGNYEDGTSGRPRIAYKDGALVEYVDLLFAGEESTRRLTLDRSVNGSRANTGDVVNLVCQVLRKSDVAYRADGTAYAVQRDKWRVLDMAPADVVAAA